MTEERYIDPLDYRYRVVDDCGDKNETTTTTRADSDPGEETTTTLEERRIRVERHISQAMIPGARLVKAEICRSLLEPGEGPSAGGGDDEMQ